MATMLIGYDVEVQDPLLGITRKFLKQMKKVHSDLDVPCTLFICGKTLEDNVEDFQSLLDDRRLFDIQQHTYSHKLLKTLVYRYEDGKIEIYKGGTLDEIREEVARTNELLRKHLGVRCIGITGPTGCYMGLIDRPDILSILHDLGIRFVRSYHMNIRDYLHWEPLPFDVQPFWYEPQGFPDMLEFPFQGFIDCSWLDSHGYDKREEYLNYVKVCIDYIIEKNLSWSYAQHDWSSITDGNRRRDSDGDTLQALSGIANRQDPGMKITRKIIEYALRKGVRIPAYNEYYQESLSNKRS